MDRRENKRVTAGFRTEILYNGFTYPGVIENLSAAGARILTDPLDNKIDFRQYEPVELKFESPEGKEINLKCTVMWSSYIPPHNVRCRIGVELIGRPWDAISLFL